MDMRGRLMFTPQLNTWIADFHSLSCVATFQKVLRMEEREQTNDTWLVSSFVTMPLTRASSYLRVRTFTDDGGEVGAN